MFRFTYVAVIKGGKNQCVAVAKTRRLRLMTRHEIHLSHKIQPAAELARSLVLYIPSAHLYPHCSLDAATVYYLSSAAALGGCFPPPR